MSAAVAPVVETITNSASSTQLLVENVSEGQIGTGSGTQSIFESIAETIINSASSTIQISDFQSEEEESSGTGAPTIVESISETLTNSAQSDQFVTEAQPIDEVGNEGTGSQTISEIIYEEIVNSAISSQEITDTAPEPDMTSVGSGTQFLQEAIAEFITNSSESMQEIVESFGESISNFSTNIPQILSAEAEAANNSGSGDFEAGDAVSEIQSIVVQSFHDLVEKLQHTYVPDGDIDTGTWTVPPLYEKVDELIALGGYPTESIESGNHPSNDTAKLSLTASDPGVDTDHYINVRFYKVDTEGGNRIDFTINLKQGSTLIATRSFTDVQETSGNPREERIELTELEASGITDYSALLVELVADEV